MRIESVSIEPYRQNLQFGPKTIIRDRFWLVITDEEGCVGVGDAAPWPPRTAAPDLVKEELSLAAERLQGSSLPIDAKGVEELTKPYLYRSSPARAAIEMALGDWWSQKNKVGFDEFIREVTDSPKTHCQKVRTNTLVAGADAAKAAIASGQKTLKVKLTDKSAVESFCSWAPTISGAKFRVDANRAFSADETLLFWPNISKAPIDYLEDPLPANDLEGWRKLAAHGLPLALDEADSELLYEEGTATVRVLKLQFEAGLIETAKRAARYSSSGGKVTITSALESSIGRAAAIHLASVVAPTGVHGLGAAEPVTDWTRIQNGTISIPEGITGLGVERARNS